MIVVEWIIFVLLNKVVNELFICTILGMTTTKFEHVCMDSDHWISSQGFVIKHVLEMDLHSVYQSIHIFVGS